MEPKWTQENPDSLSNFRVGNLVDYEGEIVQISSVSHRKNNDIAVTVNHIGGNDEFSVEYKDVGSVPMNCSSLKYFNLKISSPNSHFTQNDEYRINKDQNQQYEIVEDQNQESAYYIEPVNPAKGNKIGVNFIHEMQNYFDCIAGYSLELKEDDQ